MLDLPLFVVNGLIESGKTTLIKEIIENNASYQERNTLLIVCEEGEIEYSSDWLEAYKVNIKYIDSQEELTPDLLLELDQKYNPAQIVIEMNGFYNLDELVVPEYMKVYQQIVLINASNFGIYFSNMKQVFNNIVKYASLVIFNRCDGVTELANYRRQIRAFNSDCQIGFENSNGQMTAMLDEDLPYDISRDTIVLEDEDYPIWYMDVFDNYEKYQGKTIKFKTFVRDILEDTLVIGRNVMTCCEDDIQFLGYELIDETDSLVGIGDCIFVECQINREFSTFAGEEVVMLRAKKISKLPKEEDKVLGM